TDRPGAPVPRFGVRAPPPPGPAQPVGDEGDGAAPDRLAVGRRRAGDPGAGHPAGPEGDRPGGGPDGGPGAAAESQGGHRPGLVLVPREGAGRAGAGVGPFAGQRPGGWRLSRRAGPLAPGLSMGGRVAPQATPPRRGRGRPSLPPGDTGSSVVSSGTPI